jgi:murein DD-endopeptidase MepM/ murein hydrolase activator NlpD
VLKRVQTTVAKPADPLLYMSKPVEGKLVMQFGWQTHPVLKQEIKYEGIEIEADLGTGVHAAAAGKVKLITDSARFGKMLIIDNGNDIETVYGHLGEILVGQGEMVSQGQVIARVGKTGINSSTLYFEIREKGISIDPLSRIKGDFNSTGRR